jgi:hypothetical protein
MISTMKLWSPNKQFFIFANQLPLYIMIKDVKILFYLYIYHNLLEMTSHNSLHTSWLTSLSTTWPTSVQTSSLTSLWMEFIHECHFSFTWMKLIFIHP